MRIRFIRHAFLCAPLLCLLPMTPVVFGESSADNAPAKGVLTGQAAFTDFAHEAPGTRRHVTAADLPAPKEDESVDNGAHMVPRPDNAWPVAPKGFKVELYATGLDNPRLIRTAPNGDIFLAESRTNEIKVFRGIGADGKAKEVSVFATGLNLPFGINFYPAGPNPKWVYVGNTDGVVRFPYQVGDLKARGEAEHLLELPGGGHLRGGGHWTRDLAFSKDGTKLFVSVGSLTNVDGIDKNPLEFHRADVLEFTPDGKFIKVYASGIRNCVGEAINPTTGELWCSTNERDGLGNNLVPDYVTHVQEDGFYGWPWYYMGGPAGKPGTVSRIHGMLANTLSCRRRSSLRISWSTHTLHHWKCFSMRESSSLLAIVETALLRSMARGIARCAPVTRLSVCRCMMVMRRVSMKTSSLVLCCPAVTFGVVLWAWLRLKMDHSLSRMMDQTPSGM